MEKHILDVLKRVRKQKNITQEEIARKIGMKTNTYGDLEKGKTRIRLEDFLLICKFLDIDPISLIKGSNQIVITLSTEEADLIESLSKKIHDQKSLN